MQAQHAFKFWLWRSSCWFRDQIWRSFTLGCKFHWSTNSCSRTLGIKISVSSSKHGQLVRILPSMETSDLADRRDLQLPYLAKSLQTGHAWLLLALIMMPKECLGKSRPQLVPDTNQKLVHLPRHHGCSETGSRRCSYRQGNACAYAARLKQDNTSNVHNDKYLPKVATARKLAHDHM